MEYHRENLMIEQPKGPRLGIRISTAKGSIGPRPVIVMGHGLGTVKEDGIDSFTDSFVQKGYSVINFDYATWGASEGLPRHVIVVWDEYRDFAAVIAWARAQDHRFDEKRIIVWGSSFGGMHVTRLLAEDKALLAGIAQCPCVDAQAASWMKPPLVSLRLGFWAVLDLIGSYLGSEPIYVDNVKRNPSAPGVALMMGEDVASKWDDIAVNPLTDKGVHNQVAARSILSFPFSRPGLNAGKIEAAYLVVLPESDSVAPLQAAEKVAKMARRAEMVRVAGGHFDLYKGGVGYQKNLKAQLEFLGRICPV